MISIIPLTYLLFLALMLTPMTIFLIIQVANFFNQQLYLSKQAIKAHQSQKKKILFISNYENKYKIANIYINKKSWHLALTILYSGIYYNTKMDKYWLAKYHNAIGFIFEQLDFNIIARQHYLLASKICPNYKYALKNLNRLNSNEYNRDSRI